MSNKHHSDGQRDQARGNYRPPHEKGFLGELVFGYSKRELSDRESYRKGWRNSRKQRRK